MRIPAVLADCSLLGCEGGRGYGPFGETILKKITGTATSGTNTFEIRDNSSIRGGKAVPLQRDFEEIPSRTR